MPRSRSQRTCQYCKAVLLKSAYRYAYTIVLSPQVRVRVRGNHITRRRVLGELDLNRPFLRDNERLIKRRRYKPSLSEDPSHVIKI
jgi:hypothetical protein